VEASSRKVGLGKTEGRENKRRSREEEEGKGKEKKIEEREDNGG